MNVYKSDPQGQYVGVRVELPSGRVAERFFDNDDDRALWLDCNQQFTVVSFSDAGR